MILSGGTLQDVDLLLKKMALNTKSVLSSLVGEANVRAPGIITANAFVLCCWYVEEHVLRRAELQCQCQNERR